MCAADPKASVLDHRFDKFEDFLIGLDFNNMSFALRNIERTGDGKTDGCERLRLAGFTALSVGVGRKEGPAQKGNQECEGSKAGRPHSSGEQLKRKQAHMLCRRKGGCEVTVKG